MAKEIIPIQHKKKRPLKRKQTTKKQKKEPVDEEMLVKTITANMTDAGNTRIERYYYKIVFGFVALSVLLMILIIYFAFSKTEVTVYTKTQTQEIVLSADLQDLDGVLMLSEIGNESTFTELAGVNRTEGNATGVVTLTNETSDDQTLIATTRLLSEAEEEEDRVLFRTQESVVVPAGGSVDVQVEADVKGEEGDIAPSRFEVVALSDSLKESIYGESNTAMSGGLTETSAVSEEDIEKAIISGEDIIKKKALTLFQNELQKRSDIPANGVFIENIFIVERPVEVTNVEPGDVAEEILVNQQFTVAAPVINTEAMMEFINNQLPQELAENSIVVSNIDPSSINIELIDVSDNQTTAELTLSFTVDTTISENSDILAVEKLYNKTKEEIVQQLTFYEEIENVDVTFSPFWARRTGGSASSIDISVKANESLDK